MPAGVSITFNITIMLVLSKSMFRDGDNPCTVEVASRVLPAPLKKRFSFLKLEGAKSTVGSRWLALPA